MHTDKKYMQQQPQPQQQPQQPQQQQQTYYSNAPPLCVWVGG